MVRKMPKDKNAPKRPQSGFFQFSAVARAQLVAENPNLKLGEVGKKLGEAWKQLTDAEKAPYHAKFQEEKAVYAPKLAAYKQTPEYAQYQEEKKKFAKKNEGKKLRAMLVNQPKKAMGAYFLFSNANRARIRAANPSAKLGDIAKLIGAEWKSLGAEEKKPYQDEAAAAKKVWEHAMEEYKQTEEYKGYLEAVKKSKAKGKKGKKSPGKKKARRSSVGGSSQEDY